MSLNEYICEVRQYALNRLNLIRGMETSGRDGEIPNTGVAAEVTISVKNNSKRVHYEVHLLPLVRQPRDFKFTSANKKCEFKANEQS